MGLANLGDLIASRRTGVIVGITEQVTNEQAGAMVRRLEERFPRVVFAIVTGGSSVAFEFDHVDEVEVDL